jgi:hypothetical protein
MSVLLVTAHMLTPIAGVDPVHLDAILVAATTGARLTREDALPAIPALPVVHLEMHGERVYLCSSWQFPDGARQGRETMTKRRDGEDIWHLRAPFTPSSGPGKNYQLPVITTEAATVSWLCVGRREGVRKLLRYARAVGSKRRHGYGAVARWTVEEAPRPAMDVLLDGDVAERFLPRAWLESEEMVERGACCPPYWHPGRVVERVRPGWRCVLRGDVRRAVEGSR